MTAQCSARRSAARLLVALSFAGIIASLDATPAAAQTGRDPLAARLITEDIDRFWQAFDARAELGTARAMDSLYFKPATPGLKDWIRLRLTDAKTFALTIDKVPGYYESARESTRQIAQDEPRIRAAFDKLHELYPDAVFPDVYFVIGRLSSGGTTGPSGLLIGAEMYGRTSDAALAGLSDWLKQVLAPVSRVPAIVAHELIHYQQHIGQNTLLAQSLREGGADFVAELLTGDNINAHLHAWVHAKPGREQQLWEEFRGAMLTSSFEGWFSSKDVNARPKDLGYYMGYRVAQAYYAKQTDKTAALREIFNTKDPQRLLDESGYGADFAFDPLGPTVFSKNSKMRRYSSAHDDGRVKE